MQLNFNTVASVYIHDVIIIIIIIKHYEKIKIYTLEEIMQNRNNAHNISSMYDIKLIKERNRVT